jgi:glucose-specific phosphotransferase system IIA component
MFDFFKQKKDLLLIAPIKGRIMDIVDVPDEAFSQKMVGDGVAIEAANDVVTAPCDGEVVFIPKTLHAIALQTSEGIEILIHVGLDTVELAGQGFTALVKIGDKVKAGDRLLQFDENYIRSHNKSLLSPIVLTNIAQKVGNIEKYYGRSDGVIMKVTLK